MFSSFLSPASLGRWLHHTLVCFCGWHAAEGLVGLWLILVYIAQTDLYAECSCTYSDAVILDGSSVSTVPLDTWVPVCVYGYGYGWALLPCSFTAPSPGGETISCFLFPSLSYNCFRLSYVGTSSGSLATLTEIIPSLQSFNPPFRMLVHTFIP
ncbi:uncharacterized protein EI97DRAFT_238644 [Westerdykella ornata]|uniref:Uncharacterized protein n=1 Tax=Westerdykella ornata TaxID=318751 RepID=A0A6A6J736_WESOR|nr:uncharacterized protein EI97DRAFT_238644 [Westerdykella ornata]KAF2271973.1 hypothetical protein EI97DRAFT_238644 [Westerdykella ornata]